MYKEQYYLTIAVAVIGILAGLINPEGLAWIAAPISIIWLVGMFAIKIYKEKFKKWKLYEKIQRISDGLIADAIEDATQKAEKALVPLKQKIVGVKTVILHDNTMSYYESPIRASFDRMAMESSMKSAPIMSGDEEIRTDVSVVFYISTE